MADLTDKDSSTTTKLTGADSTGVETNYVDATVNGLKVDGSAVTQPTKDIIASSSVNGAISVTTSATIAKVGASALSNRKFICITPTNGTIYWGSNASVTVANGTPIFKNQSATISFSDTVAVYLIASGTTDVRIVEGA